MFACLFSAASDPQRVGLGVLAKPETAAYVLQNPNDVILPFWQAVTSHMQRETEMLFRAPLTTTSHLSLSLSVCLMHSFTCIKD